jgi:hypothetical protein
MSLGRVIYSTSVVLEKRTSLLESLLSSRSSLLRPYLYSVLIPEYKSLYAAFLLLACFILTVSIAPYYKGASGC